MRKLVFLLVFVILLSPVNLGEDLSEEVVICGTTSKVYVKTPNFNVLEEKDNQVVTVVLDAEVPDSYEGTLIKLDSNDLTDLVRVINNLGTERVILYGKDIEIAEGLDNEVDSIIEVI